VNRFNFFWPTWCWPVLTIVGKTLARPPRAPIVPLKLPVGQVTGVPGFRHSRKSRELGGSRSFSFQQHFKDWEDFHLLVNALSRSLFLVPASGLLRFFLWNFPFPVISARKCAGLPRAPFSWAGLLTLAW